MEKTYAFTGKLGYPTYDGSGPPKGITYQIALNYTDSKVGKLALTYMTGSGEFCLGEMFLSPK